MEREIDPELTSKFSGFYFKPSGGRILVLSSDRTLWATFINDPDGWKLAQESWPSATFGSAHDRELVAIFGYVPD